MRILLVPVVLLVAFSPAVGQNLTEVTSFGENFGTVAVSETKAVINEGTMLRVFDMTNQSSPIVGGTMDVGSIPTSILLIGNTCYGVCENGPFFVVEITDVETPVLVGQLDWEDSKRTLWVRPEEDYAYVGGCFGIHVVDITQPESPSILRTISGSQCSYSITGEGHYLYAANPGGAHLLTIYDLIVPSNPMAVGFGPPNTVSTQAAYNALEVQGDYAFIGHNSGVSIVDISEVTQPVFIKSFSSGRRVLEKNGNELIADGWFSSQRWDISNPLTPTLLDDVTSFGSGEPGQVAVVQDSILRAQTHSIYLTDTGSGSSSEIWSTYPQIGGFNGLAIKGETLFTGTQPGIASVDISNPQKPALIQKINDRYSIYFVLLETRLYSLTSEGFVNIWDVSNPFHMTKLVEYPLAGGGIGSRIDASEDCLAITANDHFHLFEIDINGYLTEAIRFVPPGGADAIAIRDNAAYIAQLDGSLLIYDITNASSPSLVTTLNPLSSQLAGGFGASLEISGNQLHMLVARAGYAVFDLSNPFLPLLLGTFDEFQFESYDIAVDYPFVFLATGQWLGKRGIRVLNIGNPANIQEVDTVDTPFHTRNLSFHQSYLFSAETRGGLRVREFSENLPSTPTPTVTHTPVPSDTPTSSPTPIPSPTRSASPTNSPSPTNSASPTMESPTNTPGILGDLDLSGDVGAPDILLLMQNWKKME